MLKKFVSSLFVILLLCGCGSKSGKDISKEQTAAETAAEIVDDLKLSDSMKEIKERHIKGYFFQSEDITTDACVYYSTETGNSDTVGVFYTDDTDTCISYLKSYLEDQKSQTQTYYPEEVFKISNAVIESNDKVVILVVCNDIESAREKVNEILGK